MGIDHVALYVNDLQKAVDFFATYFGAVPAPIYCNKTTGFRSRFLRFDCGARIEVMTRPDMVNGEKSPFRTGYSHIAFNVGSVEAVDALTARLQRDGYTVLSGPRTTGDGYYESCIAAPEQILVEITV